MGEMKHTRGMLGINNNDIDPAGWAKADPTAKVTRDDKGDRSTDLVIGGERCGRYNQPFYREQSYLSGGQWIGSTSFENRHADAARIAACWNAAERANLSNEALDAGVIEKMAEALRSIAKQWPDSAAAKTARAALSARQTTDREDGK